MSMHLNERGYECSIGDGNCGSDDESLSVQVDSVRARAGVFGLDAYP